MEYQIDPVWPSPTTSVRNEAVQFWMAQRALREDVALDRAHQLIVVARTPDNDIAAVSTATPMLIERLGLHCFYYRMFVGTLHRVKGLKSTKLAERILVNSHHVLNQRFREGHDPTVLGLYMEVEAPSVMRTRNEVVWQDSGTNAVFIGKSPTGKHCRVWYFDGARIPRP